VDLIMFKQIYYVTGTSIPTIEAGWITTTNSRKRTAIPANEILDSLKSTTQTTHPTFDSAKEEAQKKEAAALDADTSGCAFMEYESPIFEMVGLKIINVHFQGNKFTEAFLINQVDAQNKGSCTIS
jgi:hypothetical protein